ncbi:MAG TPA: hypothetical protein VKR58_11745 [Aquella sp.]|nr:hypothetical protein [Aquella sp.]
MPVKITQQPIQSIDFSMNRQFNISNGMEECYLAFDPILPPSATDELYVFLTYKFYISSLSKEEDFKLKIEVIRPFRLSPIREITPKAIFQCAVICQGELQKIFNTFFSERKNIPQVKILPFEDVQERLNAIIADLNSGDSFSKS